ALFAAFCQRVFQCFRRSPKIACTVHGECGARGRKGCPATHDHEVAAGCCCKHHSRAVAPNDTSGGHFKQPFTREYEGTAVCARPASVVPRSLTQRAGGCALKEPQSNPLIKLTKALDETSTTAAHLCAMGSGAVRNG